MGRLERFRSAQGSPGSGFDDASAEIRAGGKTGHWIWYVFPQLEGLGSSATSRAFAIADAAEAADYLRDAELRSRLLAITLAVAEQIGRGRSLRALMGSEVDARKLVSSLTLFEHVGCEALAAGASRVLAAAAAQGYPRCAHTMTRLATESS
jgi:uncharacterized protein (DUF1810 family)